MADGRRRALITTIVLDFVEDEPFARHLENDDGDFIALFSSKRKRRFGEKDPELPDSQPVRILGYAEQVVPRYTNAEFFSHFRMPRTTFEIVLNIYGHGMSKHKIHMPDITLEKKTLISIWVLSTPDSYRSVADRFGISKGNAHYCVMEFTRIFERVRSQYIRWPNDQEAQVTMTAIEERYFFPGVIGAVDGCHIKIKGPTANAESYYNRKGYTSLNIQATCDHRKKFIDLCVGWPGSVHDARIWRNSSLGQQLESGKISIPNGGHLLADSAYSLKTYMLTPYRENGHLTASQVLFNKTLSSARSVIERAFGQLKCKFRRLHYLDMERIDRMVNVINTCAMIHNLILNDSDEDEEYNDGDDDDIFEDDHHVNQINFEASAKRDLLASQL